MKPDGIISARSDLSPNLWCHQRPKSPGRTRLSSLAEKHRFVARQKAHIPRDCLSKAGIFTPSKTEIAAIENCYVELRMPVKVGIQRSKVLDWVRIKYGDPKAASHRVLDVRVGPEN